MLLFRFLFKDAFRSLTSPTGRVFLGLLLRYGGRPRFQSTEVTFGRYRFTVPDALSFVWQYKEIFTDESYYFEPKRPNPIILDCGANIGMSVTYFREKFPKARIVTFEADPAIGAILRKNLTDNRVAEIEVINKAVWTDDHGVSFASEAADSSSIFSDKPKTLIPSVRLRDYLLREPYVDLLKIDIEGAETAVLEDCRDALSRVDRLFVEFHSYIGHPQTLGTVVRILEENGFRYYVDTNQHRKRPPFVDFQYSGNAVMDLQLNIHAWRI
ncbi:FkbM family methyltransferase [Larkinella soli]|uniref:FkbM family methyltransferase n=1 Tax=Larkinella soli TaxID=1770527 RepID=UPI000FFB1B99|nr:FkbM family methyltransferase [Larkinella soli]